MRVHALALLLVAAALLPGCADDAGRKDGAPAPASTAGAGTGTAEADDLPALEGPVTLERIGAAVDQLLREHGRPYRQQA